jgi:DNA processing protein
MQGAGSPQAQPDANDLAAWLRLSLTPGIGNQRARQLLRAFGLPQQIFESNVSALGAVVSPAQAHALSQIPSAHDDLLRSTLDWLAADPQQRRVLTLGDRAYPRCLLELEDPPLILYGMGLASSWDVLADGSTGLDRAQAAGIAIVGSRNPTPQGATNAHDFAQTLAQAGLVVVSGMALGVDAAAHAGALQATRADAGAIATIAVVGTGLDRVYPKQHRALAHQIAQGGVILSEYHLGTPPLASNFPQRNRLIAGLARGTLVVEAALQSGSLITARMALEQGRDVFAIPGSIHSTQSKGCHALIKQGAKLVESAQDILEELQFATSAPAASTRTEKDKVSPALAALLLALGFDPIGLDGLQARSGLPTPQLQAQLMELELGGLVARLPGGKFQRIARA